MLKTKISYNINEINIIYLLNQKRTTRNYEQINFSVFYSFVIKHYNPAYTNMLVFC